MKIDIDGCELLIESYKQVKAPKVVASGVICSSNGGEMFTCFMYVYAFIIHK